MVLGNGDRKSTNLQVYEYHAEIQSTLYSLDKKQTPIFTKLYLKRSIICFEKVRNYALNN